MSIYTPARWVVLEINNGTEIIKKVLAGWYGGYLGSDSWKLNSGNVSEVEFDDRWEFTGNSSSVYVCYKSAYGMSGYMQQILDSWQSELTNTNTEDVVMSITILDSYNSQAE